MIAGCVVEVVLITALVTVVVAVVRSVPRPGGLVDWTKEWKRAQLGGDRFRHGI